MNKNVYYFLCKFESIHFRVIEWGEFLLKIVKTSKEISKFMALNGRNKFLALVRNICIKQKLKICW